MPPSPPRTMPLCAAFQADHCRLLPRLHRFLANSLHLATLAQSKTACLQGPQGAPPGGLRWRHVATTNAAGRSWAVKSSAQAPTISLAFSLLFASCAQEGAAKKGNVRASPAAIPNIFCMICGPSQGCDFDPSSVPWDRGSKAQSRSQSWPPATARWNTSWICWGLWNRGQTHVWRFGHFSQGPDVCPDGRQYPVHEGL